MYKFFTRHPRRRVLNHASSPPPNVKKATPARWRREKTHSQARITLLSLSFVVANSVSLAYDDWICSESTIFTKSPFKEERKERKEVGANTRKGFESENKHVIDVNLIDFYLISLLAPRETFASHNLRARRWLNTKGCRKKRGAFAFTET